MASPIDHLPLSGGLANTNYKVTLSGANEPVVLRVYTRDPDACERERALYAQRWNR